jgi:glutathione synthase/RimK-type ligase-like ATP-grasp enzyme
MLAIHRSSSGYSQDWIAYCKAENIPHKVVNCYAADILEQLTGCSGLMWHHHHTDAKDVVFARQLLSALEHAGIQVFPDWRTGWHFDDKIGQFYLLQLLQVPVVPTVIYYEKAVALQWAKTAQFPKVFKLRGGAGSLNVRKVSTEKEARQLIYTAFGSGFPAYNRWEDLKENIRRKRMGIGSWLDLAKSIRRLFVATAFARIRGRERGYILFQDFIPGNTYDTRVVTVGNKAFGIRRLVRKGDFRASGSGYIEYEPEKISLECVRLAFETSEKLGAQVVAYDFVQDTNGNPLMVEINYGYAHASYAKCPGYWDKDLHWHQGSFNSTHWMVEDFVHRLDPA